MKSENMTTQMVEESIKFTNENHDAQWIRVFKLENSGTELIDKTKRVMNFSVLSLPSSLLQPWIQHLIDFGTLRLPIYGSTPKMKKKENEILEFFRSEYVYICPIIVNKKIVGIVSRCDTSKSEGAYDVLISIATYISDQMRKGKMIDKERLNLEYLKTIDVSTGAFNREYYMQMVMNKEGLSFYDVGIVHLDFNEIRKLNETHGFEYGDRILKKIAKELIEFFAACDSHVFRISGDEFLVICRNVGKTFFSKQCREFSLEVKKDKESNVSMGIAYKSGVVDIFELILNAEKEMKKAKAKYYDKKISIDRRQELIKNLNDDLNKGIYSVYLQPKVDLNTEKLIGAEALIRKKYKNTILLPDTFIPYFETEGVISYLDLHVLEEVVKLIKEVEEKDVQVFAISVNFSRVTLMEKDIVSKMADVCEKYNVNTNKVCVEITESVNTMTMEKLVELTQEIKDAGFKLSLDDYGSHYSNVTILANIDFDEVKLDKSIIQILHMNQKAKSIVSTTINMCKGFKNTKIVAEGIETKETLDILRAFNCDCGQGFYFSEAISMKNFKEKYILKGASQKNKTRI